MCATSQASPKYYYDSSVGTLYANIFGIENLLEVAIEKKVKTFLFFSSSKIYTKTSNDVANKENQYVFLNPFDLRF